MKNPRSSDADKTANGMWHVALDDWVADAMLIALKRAVVAVREWRELPLYEHADPAEVVNLATGLNEYPVRGIELHLRDNRLGLAGYVPAQNRHWSFDMSEEPALKAPLTSFADRRAIRDRVRSWLDCIEARPKREQKLVDKCRRDLAALVAGAAHSSLSTWSEIILEPNTGQLIPRLWNDDPHLAYCPDAIEYQCSEPLMSALLEARDPFLHVSQDMRFGSHIRVRLGGAPPITVSSSSDVVEMMRLITRLPAGAAIFVAADDGSS